MISNALSWLTFLPLIGGALLLFTKKDDVRSHRLIAVAVSGLAFALSLWLLPHFDAASAAMQFVEKREWIPSLGIGYHLGVDGISLPLILLTTFLTLVSVVASFGVGKRTREYFFWFLLLEAGSIGLFASLDLFLFFVFWELTLVPMYFLIGVWGGPNREFAAMKFFLFTLFGSVFLLLGIIAVYFLSGTGSPDSIRTLDIVALTQMAANGQLALIGTTGALVFAGMFAAFAIKVPVFPFHTWLPLAHVEAPTAVSVILAGTLLKMGLYGILRICYPILPEMTRMFLPALVVLGAINVVYGAFCALAQTDMKRMVAYSSVNHMGYCLIGMAAAMGNPNAAQAGMSGAVLQMISHGIITGALFLLVGVVYDRAHTRDIDAFGGLGGKMPLFSGFLIVAAMASLGLPGLSGFIAEFLCFLGAFGGGFNEHDFRVPAALSLIGIIVTAAFFTKMIRLVVMGEANPRWEGKMPDMNARELATVVPLVLVTIALGVWPAPALRMMDAAVSNVIRLVAGGL